MSKRKRNKGKPCLLCGSTPANSDDHIIAKAFFPKGERPLNPIIAQLCVVCNTKKKSLEDSYVRDAIVMDINCSYNRSAQKVLLEQTCPSIARNQSGFSRQTFKDIPVRSPKGIYLGDAPQYHVDFMRLKKYFRDVVTELFWVRESVHVPKNRPFHFDIIKPVSFWEQGGKIVPPYVERHDNSEAVYYVLNFLKNHQWKSISLGNEVFDCFYQYNFPDIEDSVCSLWMLWFYRSILFTCSFPPIS